MELAAYLQKNAILLLSRGGAFVPSFKGLFCMKAGDRR